MILTVTLNPAYDMTYRVQNLEPGRAHRVTAVEQRVGGPGINVTRVLNQIGKYSRATGFADHPFSAVAERELPVDFVHALPWVRRTVVISECSDGTATALREPGPHITTPDAVDQLLVRVAGLLVDSSGIVISGSLPGGVRDSIPAELARLALDAGVPVVCDVDGRALAEAARVPGVVLMPNIRELEYVAGISPQTTGDVVDVARTLVEGGAGAVVVTRGADGMVAVTAAGAWSASLPEPIAGNPTGAGDAAAASVIAALAAAVDPDWPAILTEAVATSAAAVVMAVAGEVDLSLRQRLGAEVRIEELLLEEGGAARA
ncbi:hexose kinase [Nocardia spumae]|uniref:hexose kinase n=1 Tax=Nocardia spumae TaxID=2887190 RepID=UPI001D138A30|nr:hexose kinase [Nocardia spumae]